MGTALTRHATPFIESVSHWNRLPSVMQQDPPAKDAYTEHLADVNKSKAVLAAEDIVNTQGVLVAKKGTNIDEKTAGKIMTFKLTKPLENSVSIENEIDGAALLHAVRAFLKENEQLKSIHDRVNMESGLPRLTSSVNSFPIIKQKLTVMSVQMPNLYQQSLFSAWLAALIGKRMSFGDGQVMMLFLSGLTHDIGMLHISPELLSKKGELLPEEWRQIQAHPVIGQKILETMDKLPKEISRAVLEHHERVDGSGYPGGKAADELHLYGQIVAMTDAVQGAYRQHVQSSKGTIRNLFPILQMNSESHFYKTYEALITTLKQAGIPENTSLTDTTMPAAVAFVRENYHFLNVQLQCLSKIVACFPQDNTEKDLRAIDVSLMHSMKTIRGAGILDDGYLRWMDQLEQNKLAFGYRELEDVVLMMKELKFQINRILKMARAYTEFGKNPALRKTIAKLLEEHDGSTEKTSA